MMNHALKTEFFKTGSFFMLNVVHPNTYGTDFRRQKLTKFNYAPKEGSANTRRGGQISCKIVLSIIMCSNAYFYFVFNFPFQVSIYKYAKILENLEATNFLKTLSIKVEAAQLADIIQQVQHFLEVIYSNSASFPCLPSNGCCA